ncbi:hypothetical protein AAVH_05824 [Aphelenchoides avenae]|nr:hypothetical protein AAVH_05824 [Aphelenchus avenae]
MELDFNAYEKLTPELQHELDEEPVQARSTPLYNASTAPLRQFNVVTFGQLLSQPVMQNQIRVDRIPQNGTQRAVFCAIPPTNTKEFELRRHRLLQRERQKEAHLRRSSMNFMQQYAPSEEEKRRNDADTKALLRKQKAEAKKRSSGMATTAGSSSTRRNAQPASAVPDPFDDRPGAVANVSATPPQSARSTVPVAQLQQQAETGPSNDQTAAAAAATYDNASQVEINHMRYVIEGIVRDVELHTLEGDELCRRLKITDSTALTFFHKQKPRVMQFIQEHCQRNIDHVEIDNRFYFAWKTPCSAD